MQAKIEVIYMKGDKLIIKKRGGEDGYKNFSVRLRTETVEKLDEISRNTNRSRNELINLILDYGIDNCEIR